MGLRETLRGAAVTAIAAVGNVAISVKYKSIQDVEMDTTNGVEATFASYENVEGVFVDYKEDQIDGENILPRDQMFLTAGSLIPFTPKASDRIEFIANEDLETWEVIGVDVDPVGALYVLQARQIN